MVVTFCWYLVCCQFLLCLSWSIGKGAKPPDLQGSGKGALGITSLGGTTGVLFSSFRRETLWWLEKKTCSIYDGLEKTASIDGWEGQNRLLSFKYTSFVPRLTVAFGTCTRTLKPNIWSFGGCLGVCHGIPDIQGILVVVLLETWDISLEHHGTQLHPGTWAKDLAARQGASTHIFSLAGVWCSWSLEAICLATLNTAFVGVTHKFWLVKSKGKCFFSKCPTQCRFRI